MLSHHVWVVYYPTFLSLSPSSAREALLQGDESLRLASAPEPVTRDPVLAWPWPALGLEPVVCRPGALIVPLCKISDTSADLTVLFRGFMN